MCGIAGLLLPASPAEALPAARRMARLLAHRGPDDEGFHQEPSIGLALAHRRLAILDLSPAGHQPMWNEDRTVALVFNGELYNFAGLRKELLAAGHTFTSRTDSEVLVHGYEEWGDAVVDRLAGMFAFAIWDARKARLFLARDPLGIKPLYYTVTPAGGFAFASELKAFRAVPGFVPVANRRALAQFLEFNYVYDEHETTLAGVSKLPPGHTLDVDVAAFAAGARPSPARRWSPPAVEPGAAGPAEAARRTDALEDLLTRVVGEHLVADVPVGLLLSGGLDSSLVAALASRGGPVRTLCMAFADSSVDERPFARRVAEHIGSRHEEVVIRPGEMVADLERSVWFVDDLFGDWGVISTMVLYRKCREAGVKVVLVGEGSDELFGGYSHFQRFDAPAADRRSIFRRSLGFYQNQSGRRWGRELWGVRQILREYATETHGDFFSAVRLFEIRRQLPSQYNMKVDKACMAASVEARVPFQDVRVAEAALRLPRALLMRDGRNKAILREIASRNGLLPPEIATRGKYGASIAASWMDEVPSFRGFARDVVLDPAGWAAPLGVEKAMRDYFDRGRGGYRFPHPVSIFSIVAWRLLFLNLWSKQYLAPAEEAAA